MIIFQLFRVHRKNRIRNSGYNLSILTHSASPSRPHSLPSKMYSEMPDRLSVTEHIFRYCKEVNLSARWNDKLAGILVHRIKIPDLVTKSGLVPPELLSPP